jgi:hypothetical protein
LGGDVEKRYEGRDSRVNGEYDESNEQLRSILATHSERRAPRATPRKLEIRDKGHVS